MGGDHARPLRRAGSALAGGCASTRRPAGSTLTAQQPDVNVVRVALQALAAVLGGTQSLHTNAADEALALPDRKRSARLALPDAAGDRLRDAAWRTTADPLGGSFLVEEWTDEIANRARALIARIDSLGGAVAAIECRLLRARDRRGRLRGPARGRGGTPDRHRRQRVPGTGGPAAPPLLTVNPRIERGTGHASPGISGRLATRGHAQSRSEARARPRGRTGTCVRADSAGRSILAPLSGEGHRDLKTVWRVPSAAREIPVKCGRRALDKRLSSICRRRLAVWKKIGTDLVAAAGHSTRISRAILKSFDCAFDFSLRTGVGAKRTSDRSKLRRFSSLSTGISTGFSARSSEN